MPLRARNAAALGLLLLSSLAGCNANIAGSQLLAQGEPNFNTAILLPNTPPKPIPAATPASSPTTAPGSLSAPTANLTQTQDTSPAPWWDSQRDVKGLDLRPKALPPECDENLTDSQGKQLYPVKTAEEVQHCLYVVKAMIDDAYREYRITLHHFADYGNAVGDIAQAGLSGASTGPVGAVAHVVLSGLSTFVGGVKSTVNQDLFYKTAIEIIIHQMDADRHKRFTVMLKEMSLPDGNPVAASVTAGTDAGTKAGAQAGAEAGVRAAAAATKAAPNDPAAAAAAAQAAAATEGAKAGAAAGGTAGASVANPKINPNYSWAQAKDDLLAYFAAGTWDHALTSLQAASATNQTNCETETDAAKVAQAAGKPPNTTSGTGSGKTDATACPSSTSPGGASAPVSTPVSSWKIQFASASASLDSSSKTDVKTAATAILAAIKNDPTTKATVIGYTSSVGEPPLNQKLATDRAKAVITELGNDKVTATLGGSGGDGNGSGDTKNKDAIAIISINPPPKQ